ncbi:hypothetical protein ABZ357_19255 [Streptomyces sp. NPDC005917]|uniref:hypothetical protein n=1 Tax=unclassified Streptomyces TaxID=2593676 RepID=UPI0033E83544
MSRDLGTGMGMRKRAATSRPYGSEPDLRKLRVLMELDRRGAVISVAAALHLTPQPADRSPATRPSPMGASGTL